RANAQPPRTRGYVSQFGTLSFQPSITAATIIAALTKSSGQWSREKMLMTRNPRHASSHLGEAKAQARASRVARWTSRRAFGRGPAQLDVVEILLPTYWNVLLALEPRALIATMHTTMIRANMTAYSTAVGPSSFFRKFKAN